MPVAFQYTWNWEKCCDFGTKNSRRSTLFPQRVRFNATIVVERRSDDKARLMKFVEIGRRREYRQGRSFQVFFSFVQLFQFSRRVQKCVQCASFSPPFLSNVDAPRATFYRSSSVCSYCRCSRARTCKTLRNETFEPCTTRTYILKSLFRSLVMSAYVKWKFLRKVKMYPRSPIHVSFSTDFHSKYLWSLNSSF